MRPSTAIALLALVGAALGSTGLAAQSPGGATPPGAERSDAAPPRGAGGAGPRRGPDRPGPGPRRGPPPQDLRSFEIRLDDDRRLRVQCGRESLESCIDAAAPLLDLLTADGARDRDARSENRERRRAERQARREERRAERAGPRADQERDRDTDSGEVPSPETADETTSD